MKLVWTLMLVMVLVYGQALAGSPTPCDGINRDLSTGRAAELAPEIQKQLKTPGSEFPNVPVSPSVKVLQSFRFKQWSIIYVSTGISDEVFLFYPGDPLARHFAAAWGGAVGFDRGSRTAELDAEHDVRSWLVGKVPGLPARLANCFAWHVVEDRDQ